LTRESGQGSGIGFFRSPGAFLGLSACGGQPQKPGYTLQFLSRRRVPCGGFRDFRFYPLHGRKSASMRIFAFRSFCCAKTPGIETADILSA
jgi:hypothetical protein